MPTITAQNIGSAGTDLTMTAATAAGDQCVHESNLALLVYNGDASGINVTFPSQVADSLGVTSADNVVAVAATNLAVIPIGNPAVYKDGNGDCLWTYSADTSVEVAVIRRF
jgi:hypothetical protein